MEIIFQKGLDAPDRLICRRADGSTCEEALSPNSAYHDLAHFVVEEELGIREGIWGMLAQGHTMAEYNLPDDLRPFPLTPEAYRAEFLATLIQSAVHTGSIDPRYAEMLREVCLASGLPFPELPPTEMLQVLIAKTQALTKQWEGMAGGEKLELKWKLG